MTLQMERTELDDVLLLSPQLHGDARGYFLETYNAHDFRRVTGVDACFVQDNQSRSGLGVLRGLHYQVGEHAQGKLVRAVAGRIFDVAVDLRRQSVSFGRWTGRFLDAEAHRQLWIPPGFAHGFLVMSEVADVAYKTTKLYAPQAERCIRFDDPRIGIVWPAEHAPVVSTRDAQAGSFEDAETFP